MVRKRYLSLILFLTAVLCLCLAFVLPIGNQVQAEANPYCNLPLAVVTFSGGGVASGGEYLTNGEIANPNYCYVVSGTTTKQLYIRYAGSSECTFYVVLRNYSFTAGAWQGAVKIVSNVPIHIVMFVEGQNKILGYNHSGISADGTMNYDIVFSTVNEGTLEVGSQYSDVKALQSTRYVFDNNCTVTYISNPEKTNPTVAESNSALQNACNITRFKFTLKSTACEHNYVRTVTTEPTCTEKGEATLVCPRCHDTKTEAIEPLGHDVSDEWTIDVRPTFDDVGSKSHHCNRCDEKFDVTEIAKLERTIEKEDVKELIVISEESTETVEEAIATIEQETLVDIVETVNVELNDLEKQLSSGAITQEVYEERVEIVTAVTESAIIVGSQMAQAEEKGEEVLSVLPQNIDLDLGGYFNDFYARQMSLLLGKGESPVANARKIVASVGGIGSRTVYRDAEAPSSQGIDYGISAETYRGVVEFVDSSVDKMTNAALMIRNCSGEHLKKSVKDYIEKVSVSSFRDFDKEAANEEFVENAYQAILLNMQQQVLASLQQAYEDGKKGVSFGSNPAVDEAYQNQVEAVSDIEQFEIMVTEILRQKYNSLPQVTEPIEDVDEFYPVYRSIFRKWALNEEGEVDITLEQLTNATISEVNHKGTHIDINTTLTADEVATLVIFGVAVVAVAGVYIVFTMIKKEGDAE